MLSTGYRYPFVEQLGPGVFFSRFFSGERSQVRRERGARGTSVARVSRFSPSSAANGYFEGRGTGGKALVQQKWFKWSL